MAIKRISELDSISTQLSDLTDSKGYLKPEALSVFVFETSEFSGEINEANSYYISKKIDGDMIKQFILNDVDRKFEDVYTYIDQEINKFNQSITNINADLTEIKRRLNKIETVIKFEGGNANISCTNLTVQNPINGCAMSAFWC